MKRKAEYRFYWVAHVLHFHKNVTLAKKNIREYLLLKGNIALCLMVILLFHLRKFFVVSLSKKVRVKLGRQALYEWDGDHTNFNSNTSNN